jgi:hypothetical protein
LLSPVPTALLTDILRIIYYLLCLAFAVQKVTLDGLNNVIEVKGSESADETSAEAKQAQEIIPTEV